MKFPEGYGSSQPLMARRATRRHRRNRRIRRALLFIFLFLAVFGTSSVALHFLHAAHFRAYGSLPPDNEALDGRQMLLRSQQENLRAMENRLVYPYSVVPGGVRDVAELKWAADHDPVVRAHYAGFDYDHARVVRLVLERTAYVSYRIGNKVYWTRRRIKLKKGETVITDGKITARARCANRVEEVPQQANSAVEPPAVTFDEPMQPGIGPAVQSAPMPLQSALLNHPSVGPTPPLGIVSPLGGENWIPISPPPLPGVCGVGKKIIVHKKGAPCAPGGGGEVPEPGTWVLMGSGVLVFGWIYRRRWLSRDPLT